jgi:hypothetical protein
MVLSLPKLHVLLDSASLMIYHSPEHDYLLAKWLGHHDAESARLGCQQLLQIVHQTGSTRLLNDSSEAFGDWTEVSVWIGAVFAPQLQQAGIRSIAWVNAMDWPARNCVATSLYYIERPFIASFDFDQAEEAQRWLMQPDC